MRSISRDEIDSLVEFMRYELAAESVARADKSSKISHALEEMKAQQNAEKKRINKSVEIIRDSAKNAVGVVLERNGLLPEPVQAPVSLPRKFSWMPWCTTVETVHNGLWHVAQYTETNVHETSHNKFNENGFFISRNTTNIGLDTEGQLVRYAYRERDGVCDYFATYPVEDEQLLQVEDRIIGSVKNVAAMAILGLSCGELQEGRS